MPKRKIPKLKQGPSPKKPMRPKLTRKQFENMKESWLDVKDAVSKKNVHQDPRSKQAARYRHMLDNPKRIPKASPHADRSERLSPGLHKLKKGGKVKRKK